MVRVATVVLLALLGAVQQWARVRARLRLLERMRVDYLNGVARPEGEPDPVARERVELAAARVDRLIRNVPGADASLGRLEMSERFPYLATGQEIDVLDNLLAPRDHVRARYLQLLDQAIAHYRAGEREARRPGGLVSGALFLPRRMLGFLGFATDRWGPVQVLLQGLYWGGLGWLAFEGLRPWLPGIGA